MKNITLVIILYATVEFTSCGFIGNKSIPLPLAYWLVEGGIRDSKYISNEINFIIDEANMPTFIGYMNLEDSGYIKMTQIDSSYCCKKFNIEFLEKSEPFIIDSNYEKGFFYPLIRTLTYDSIEIVSIESFPKHSEITYKVINPLPTPFNQKSYYDYESTKISYEAICYVRKSDEDVWQIDHRPFRDI